VPHIRGLVGWRRVGRVEGWVGELTMSVDTADQVVCTVTKLCPINGHSSSSRHILEQNWMPSYPINAPQWPHRVCFGTLLLDRVDKRPSVKADLLIYSSFATVSGHCSAVWLL